MRVRDAIRKIARRSPAELFREAARRFRVASRLERRWGGRAFLPYALSFWITRRCNLNCAMCWVATSRRAEGDAYVRGGDELTLAELKAVADDVAAWRPRVGITGGEPLLRPDTPDFIAYLKSRRFRVGVNTNGTLLPTYAGDLVEAGVDSVMVSIDGPPAVHDAIRGGAGAFERARAGVRALAAERRRRRAVGPHLKITCTVSRANVGRLAETVAQFGDAGIDEFTFQHLWFTDRAVAAAQRRLFQELFEQDTTYLAGFVTGEIPPLPVAALTEERRRLAAAQYPFAVNFYPPLAENEIAAFYTRPSEMLRRPCFSRWLRVDVMPWGGVTPCLGLEAGNVRDEPLTAIWNNELFRRFRRELARRKVYPGCARCCGLFSD
jgi:MoaA/NifB/PqqE/SkfB family radical SAM enzyme